MIQIREMFFKYLAHVTSTKAKQILHVLLILCRFLSTFSLTLAVYGLGCNTLFWFAH
jgi:hypothetical protein